MGRIKFRVHYSFIIFACILIFFGQGFLLLNYFATILLHELSHAFVARRLGYNIQNIKLTPFGICLNLKTSTIDPDDEIKIAVAGPICNLVITLLLFALWWIIPSTYNSTYFFCYANLVTCLFNLFPAFPLDGGRVFRAIIRKNYNDKVAYKTCMIVNIAFSILLVFMFVLSIYVQVNMTYLFVIFCILPSPNENENYTFINYSLIKKRRKIVKIKNIYIKDSEPLYKALKYIDSFSFLNLYVYDDDDNFKSIVGEKELLKMLESYPATFLLRDVKKVG